MSTTDNPSIPRGSHAGMMEYQERDIEAAGGIRLLKAVALFASGGTEGQVVKLASNLDRSRFALQFVCLRKWGHLLDEIEKQQIPVSEYRINSLYKPRAFIQQLRLAAYMRAHRIQIVHSYNFYANVFAIPAAKLAGVPVVVASIRDRGVYLTNAQQYAQKWICKLADRVLVNADAIRDWLVEDGYNPEKISVIRNGIDTSRYKTTGDEAALREELGIPPAAPVVMMVSRLNPQKGVDDFIKAAALVSSNHPDARFVLVGEKLRYRNGNFETDTDYHEELRRFAAGLGLADRVILAGHREDVPELLSQATVSVLPSLSEGLSNTLLESMAAGIPTVATRVGGSPELVRDGVNGILVPPASPLQLAGAINRILDDKVLADRFSLEARQRVKRHFSLERMVQDTQDMYFSQLEQKRHTRSA